MNIGEKILDLREKNKISQQELAYLMEVSRQTVSKWECGNSDPEVNKLVRLAKIFKVTTDYLLDNVNDKDEATILAEKQKKVEDAHKFYAYQKQVVENFYKNNPDFKESENRLCVNQPHCHIVLDVKKINNDTIFIPNIVEKVGVSANYDGPGLKIEIEDTIADLSKMFKGKIISTIDLTNFDTKKVKSLEGFLSGIKSVNCIKGFENLNLNNHKSIRQLFKDSTIGTLDGINNMNVSNIEDFTSAFSNCKIDTLNISNWDISSMKTSTRTKEDSLPISSYIFYRAVINDLNVSNWVLNSVKHTIAWFAGCRINKLQDITNWNMQNVLDCSGMFNSAIIKQTNDLTKLNISKDCSTKGMFELYKN